ncbi:hypothetical protein JYU34_004785, partial [Plutella xylostella]
GAGRGGPAGGAPRGAGAVRRAPRAATDVFTRSPRKQSVREFSANDSVFMALLLLRVLLLGALAAAADDVPVVWSAGRSTLACTARAPPRRAQPPLDADRRPHPVTWTHDGQDVPEKRSVECVSGRH